MTIDLRANAEKPHAETLLGIDVGSVTLSLVLMDLTGRILDTKYLFHKGQIRECLLSAGKLMALPAIRGIACCASPCFDTKVVT